MTEPDDALKADLVRYLQHGRDAVVWKLDGLSELDARRPLTPTGTSLLGLVKHLADVELGYFVECFGREAPDRTSWSHDDPLADMWATADESREDVVGLYRRVWEHAAGTFAALPLDAVASVPWWSPPGDRPTLHRLLVHVATETHRHAGHADVLRELVDGAAGMRPESTNLPDGTDWPTHVARVQAAAEQADRAARAAGGAGADGP